MVRRCFWGMKISQQRERHGLRIKQKECRDRRSWRPVQALEIVHLWHLVYYREIRSSPLPDFST